MFDKQLIGTETEYGSQNRKTSKPDADVICSGVKGRFHTFLPNGGRAYVDIGEHFEYGTPECLTPREATIYHHAGDLIVMEAINKRPIDAYRVNEAPSADSIGLATFGCHENYLLRKDRRDQVYATLVPFLVTRPVFTGSGSLLGGKFRLSQRSNHITQVIGAETTSHRPLINTREENGLCSERYERLHLIGGDANVSPWATYLKLGSTAIVIALAEIGVSFASLDSASPVEDLKALNQSPPQGENDYWPWALDVQEHYLERADVYARKGQLPDWSSEVIGLWEMVLTDLRADWQRTIGVSTGQRSSTFSWSVKTTGSRSTRRRRPQLCSRITTSTQTSRSFRHSVATVTATSAARVNCKQHSARPQVTFVPKSVQQLFANGEPTPWIGKSTVSMGR